MGKLSPQAHVPKSDIYSLKAQHKPLGMSKTVDLFKSLFLDLYCTIMTPATLG